MNEHRYHYGKANCFFPFIETANGNIYHFFMENSGNRGKSSLNGILAVICAIIQYVWAFLATLWDRHTGILKTSLTAEGFIPSFRANLVLAFPSIMAFCLTSMHYRRSFGEEMDYVKTDRYTLTLFITTVYTLMLPFSCILLEPARHGAYAWFYFLFFTAFLEEFLYRGLVVHFIEESSFRPAVKYILPALLYALYQTAIPFAREGFTPDVVLSSLPDVALSVILHYLFLASKKWSGAMWCPIMLHAMLDLSSFLIFR